jgi:hypothetical protein
MGRTWTLRTPQTDFPFSSYLPTHAKGTTWLWIQHSINGIPCKLPTDDRSSTPTLS